MSSISQRDRELLNKLSAVGRRVAREETMESVSGSVDTFLELTDTPSSYAGATLYFVRVNSGTAALSFGTVDWTDIYSKPSTFAPSAHASSHYAGSADAVGTAMPTANAIPYADGSGKLDAWISDAGTATLGKAAFTSGDFTVNGGTVSIDNAHGDARYYTKTEVQTSGSAAIHYNNLTNVPTAGTSTLGISAFNSGNFTVSGGTVSIGTIYPRYSGVPTAGAMAYWTAAGTLAAATFGTAPFAQYSGTAGAGALAYYTGTGTITASGTYGTANLVLTSGNQTVEGVKTFTDGVGVGTPSPVDSVLHVRGTNAQTGGITIESSAGIDADRLAIYPLGNYSIALKMLSANGTMQFLDSGGNVVFIFDTTNNRGGFGVTGTPSGKLHVDQSSTTAAIPVLVLDQADVSEPIIEFETTVGTGNSIEAVGAKVLTTTHFLKVKLPDNSVAYIPMGTIA